MEIEGSEAEIILIENLLKADGFQTEHETYPHLAKKYGVQNGGIIETRFV